MRYDTLLLDLDHTLLDSDTSEAAAFEATLRDAGVDAPQRHFATYVGINQALWAAVERGEIGPGDVKVARFERLVAAIGLTTPAEDLAEAYADGLATHGDLYPGARELLAGLAGRARLALVTNGLADVQRTRIARLELEPYFDAIVISSEVGAAKPGPAIFDVTFDALDGPAKERALMFGDSLTSDIKGGHDYGIATCWYNPRRKPMAGAVRPRFEVARLDQLAELAAEGAVAATP